MAFTREGLRMVRPYISPALKANGAKECERRRRKIEAGQIRIHNGLMVGWCPVENGDCRNNCGDLCIRAGVRR